MRQTDEIHQKREKKRFIRLFYQQSLTRRMFQLFVKSLFQQKVLGADPLLDFTYIRYLLDDQKFH